MFGFNNTDELMAVEQLTEGPIDVLSDGLKSFEWFCMIDEEGGVDAGYGTICDSGLKETASEFGVADVTNRRSTHDCFSMIADES